MLLRKATYELQVGDRENVAHLLNELRPAHPGIFPAPFPGLSGAEHAEALAAWNPWKPEWRRGYGTLQIVAGVPLVGQKGAVLAGRHAGLEVESEGVRFESLHLPRGVFVEGGSLMMTKCVSTGSAIQVDKGASLVMEDTRDFDCADGVDCYGKMKATRGLFVVVEEASAKLVDCVIRNNGTDGLWCEGKGATVTVRGGTVSGNTQNGVVAGDNGKITVSKEQPTVSKDNERHDRLSERGGVLEGVAEEKITHDPFG